MTIINESGMYSLILSSHLESAKRFKRWVTSEVLPSIRRDGGYLDGQDSMSGEELMAKAILFADNKIKHLQDDVTRMRPKEIFADAVATSDRSILIGELAKILKQNGVDTGQQRLFERLRGRKGSWSAGTDRTGTCRPSAACRWDYLKSRRQR